MQELKKFFKVVDNSDNYNGSIDFNIIEVLLPKDTPVYYPLFKTRKTAQKMVDKLYYHRLTD